VKIQTFNPSGVSASAPTGREGGIRPSKRRTEVPSVPFLVLIPSLLFGAWLVLIKSGHTLDAQAKVFDVILKIVTISAAIIGSTWSYFAFFRQRLKEPRLNVTHEIYTLDLPEGSRLLKVYATITNIGQVRVELFIWRLRADQILPLTKTPTVDLAKGAFTDAYGHAHWNCLAEGNFNDEDGAFLMALEPGETDRASANLVIRGGVEAVQVYSHFSWTKNEERPAGWASRTLIDFRKS